MNGTPDNLRIGDLTLSSTGVLTLTVHEAGAAAPPQAEAMAGEGTGERADSAGLPTFTLVDIAGREIPVLSRDIVPKGDWDRLHILRFQSALPDPQSDPPSFLLTIETPGGPPGGGARWIAPSTPPTSGGGGGSGPDAPGVERAGATDIDYTARDFTTLRAMMQARLAQNLQGDSAWALDHPADPLMTVAEILAARGDYLSYQQDAVGTEAYLTTARRRLSLRRHARLLDYAVNDGCNARTWLAFTVQTDTMVPAGTLAVTPQPGIIGLSVPAGQLAPGTTPFETMEALSAFSAINDLGPRLTQSQPVTIPAGTWSLALSGQYPGLVPGRVLVFEQLIAPTGAVPFGAHAVRLVQVEATQPHSGGAWTTQITWHPEDALPRPLSLPATKGAGQATLYGNVVLADHGLTSPAGMDWTPTGDDTATVQAVVQVADPIFAAPPPCPAAGWTGASEPADRATLIPSAAASLAPDPSTAVAQVVLNDGTADWHPVRDLLRAPATARLFAVEPDNVDIATGQRRLLIRFGDGTLGRRLPGGVTMTATVRVGLGQTGQVRPRSLMQLVGLPAGTPIQHVINPLAAAPAPPESDAAVRLFAPTAFRVQRRGVTADDWTNLAERQPLVTSVGVTPPGPDDTGCHIAIETAEPADATFVIVRDYLLGFAVIGAPPTITRIQPVPVDIMLSVYAKPGADLSSLRLRLRQRLGTGFLDDGTPAFFNPRRFPPGRSVVLGDLLSAITSETGVNWVNINPETDPRVRFTRQGDARNGADAEFPDNLTRGFIPIAPTERVQVSGDPNRPQDGQVRFYLIASPS